MLGSVLDRFRIISAIEGLSYLFLVFFAMPIKYIGDNPYPVKVLGMFHGVLFILFMISLFESKIREKWNMKLSIELFILSLIPFGAYYIEKKVKPKKAI